MQIQIIVILNRSVYALRSKIISNLYKCLVFLLLRHCCRLSSSQNWPGTCFKGNSHEKVDITLRGSSRMRNHVLGLGVESPDIGLEDPDLDYMHVNVTIWNVWFQCALPFSSNCRLFAWFPIIQVGPTYYSLYKYPSMSKVQTLSLSTEAQSSFM